MSAIAAVSRCSHYWLLGPPQGEVMYATCSRCRAGRTFPVEPAPVRSSWPSSKLRSLGEREAHYQPVLPIKQTKGEKRTKKWYERHREAVLQDFERSGLEETRRQWGMRGNTLEKLLALWSQSVKAPNLFVPEHPIALFKEKEPLPSSQAVADRILAALIERKLISGSYLTIGLCILEALSGNIPAQSQERTS